MTTRRIFIAIDLSEAARAECVRQIDELRHAFPKARVGFERPEKLHITLKFLGDTEDQTLIDLQSAIRDIAARLQPMTLRLADPGVFPSRHRDRIMWIGMSDPAEAVGSLQRDVETACLDLGFQRENRDFAPHVTIGRIRQPETTQAIVDHHLAARIDPVELEVSALSIYESHLRRTGSVYSRISSFRSKPVA